MAEVRPLVSSYVTAAGSSSLRPVSRISFNLTDTDAFERAAHFAVRWLGEKAGGVLPPEAEALKSFDTRGSDGYHPCHVVRLDDHSGSVWAARIDEPGSQKEAGETWSTEIFVEGGRGRLVRFGVQLMTRRAVSNSLLRPSRPRLVHDLLRQLSAEEDDESLTETVTDVGMSDAAWLDDLIHKPGRRLPIVVTSTYDGRTGEAELRQLAVRLSGSAHLVAVNPEASWELTRILGKRMSTFNGATRIYMPNVTEDDDPHRHPLFFASSSGSSRTLLDRIAERVFPLGFRDRDGEGHFWRLAQLRQLSSQSEARLQTGSEVEKLTRTVAARDDEIDRLSESLEIARALEKIAAENEALALSQVEQLKVDVDRLKARIYQLGQIKVDGNSGPSSADRSLENYDDLRDWAEDVLSPHIVLHNRALKECRQHGHVDMLHRIEKTLLTIRDYWIPSKLHGGLERKTACKEALAALGVEDEPCFARRDRARERPDYAVPEGSASRVLYDHFKYGNSRSNSEQFRIYYSWDDENERMIIGKMPSHLPNDQT